MDSPLGLESGVVRLVEYDPRWPELFLAEAARLHPVVTPLSITLEHIGSTAIPGLCAKPVLDILAGYDDPARLPDCIAGLTAAGYVHRGEQGIPGREFFRRGTPRAYHIHLARQGGSFWRDHLRFRDALRADAALRDGYARVKRELAAKYPTDREAYIEGKAPFVREVLITNLQVFWPMSTASSEPFFREAGTGPGVVCLHANASTSSQWRALIDLLAPTSRVLAPDFYGAGKSPEWQSDRSISLHDEAAFIEPVLARAEPPLALVGHSYGAAVALVAALADPTRLRALVLYEPTLFSVLDAETPPPNEADDIRTVVREASRAVDAGDRDAAARRFIDYWMGAGSWEQMPEQRKAPIAASIVNVGRWGHALLTAPTPVEAFRSLSVPVLYMIGTSSPRSAHGVARILTSTLPNVEVVELDGLGHMGPVTHPEVVNPVIARFLRRA